RPQSTTIGMGAGGHFRSLEQPTDMHRIADIPPLDPGSQLAAHTFLSHGDRPRDLRQNAHPRFGSGGSAIMTIRRVGLIGAGLMGHGIGKNILAKGYELVVMAHRNRAPVDDLIARGATERASARRVAADADMVILCVTGTPQIEGLVYGDDGLLGAVRDG